MSARLQLDVVGQRFDQMVRGKNLAALVEYKCRKAYQCGPFGRVTGTWRRRAQHCPDSFARRARKNRLRPTGRSGRVAERDRSPRRIALGSPANPTRNPSILACSSRTKMPIYFSFSPNDGGAGILRWWACDRQRTPDSPNTRPKFLRSRYIRDIPCLPHLATLDPTQQRRLHSGGAMRVASTRIANGTRS
jgi:hypothetical protein